MAHSQDIGMSEVSKFLNALTNLIGTSPASHVLEVDRHDALANELIRLERSLDQYMTREHDLFYVGLMGHFSTGKSSTINSLLALAGTQHAREIGVNPTDRHVTLITHPRNTKSLIALNRESSVPIRTYPIESELLHTMVLADTPGAGDPALISDLMRDFLPVCDLILYFFSAASPLDSADMPVLEQMHERLPFLPKRFVVTRADEFRKDKRQCLSDENYDPSRAELEISRLITRTKELMPAFSVESEDYVLVDNIVGFGLDELRTRLQEYARATSTTTRANLHVHKQAYFRRRATDIRDAFFTIADKKVATLQRFVDAAKKNIEKYQEKVYITNSKLTGHWIGFSERLADDQEDAISMLPPAVTSAEVPTTMWTQSRLADWRTMWTNSTRSSANDRVADCADTLRRSVRGYIGNWVGQKRRAINLHKPLSAQLRREVTDVEVQFEPKFQLDSQSLRIGRGPIYDLNTRVSETLTAVNRTVAAKAAILQRLSEVARPLDQCDEIHEEARANIRADVDAFLETVRIYRSAMFALQLKEYIAELGIGRPLDDIDRELDPEFCESTKLSAVTSLFPEQMSVRDKFKVTADAVASAVRQVQDSLCDPSSHEIDNGGECATSDAAGHADLDRLMDQLRSDAREAVKRTITRCASDLEGHIAAGQDALAERTRVLLKQRSKFALKLAGLFATFGVVGYLVLRWELVIRSDTAGPALGVGVLANAVFFILTWSVGRLAYGMKARELRSRTDIEAEVRSACEDALDAAMVSVDAIELETGPLENAIVKKNVDVLERLHECDAVKRHEEAYASAVAGAATVNEKIGAYADAVRELVGAYQEPFANHNRNLEVLAEISGGIREKAIEPSFGTLQELETQFKQVKDALDQLRLG